MALYERKSPHLESINCVDVHKLLVLGTESLLEALPQQLHLRSQAAATSGTWAQRYMTDQDIM